MKVKQQAVDGLVRGVIICSIPTLLHLIFSLKISFLMCNNATYYHPQSQEIIFNSVFRSEVNSTDYFVLPPPPYVRSM